MSCEIFVGNLNPDVRMRDLENVYGRYGKILRCDLKKNFAFIQFDSRREAEQAIQKENNQKLLGSIMTVEWAKGSVGDKGFRGPPGGGRPRPRSPRGGGGRFRDRSPYGGGGGGRPRSPGRNFSGPPRSGFSPREDRFNGGGIGGGRSRFNGSRDYDNPRMDRGPPRDRPRGSDRFNSGGGVDRFGSRPIDRGDRRGPPRGGDRFNDRPRNDDRVNDRRDSFSDRRSFGGGPRRF